MAYETSKSWRKSKSVRTAVTASPSLHLNTTITELPHNMLVVDTAAYERQLFAQGQRGSMTDVKTGKPRSNGSVLSLDNVLRSLGVDVQCTLHNSGNDAFLTMLALQLLVAPEGVNIPPAVGLGGLRRVSTMPMVSTPSPGLPASFIPPIVHPGFLVPVSPHGIPPGSPRPFGDDYFSQRRLSNGHGSMPRPSSGLSMNGRSPHRLSSFTPDEMGAITPERRGSPGDPSLRNGTRRQPGRPSSTGPKGEETVQRSRANSGGNRLGQAMNNMTLG
jgi:hypothetical protein